MNMVRSIVAAFLIAVVTLGFSVRVIAPRLPRVVGRPDVSENLSFDGLSGKTLRLRNSKGRVSISVSEDSAFSVSARIRGFATDGDVSALRAYTAGLVRIEQNEEAVEVVTEPEARPDAIELYVDYEIELPFGTDVFVENDNGDVMIGRGCGGVDVRCNNGSIKVWAPQGPVSAETNNGRLRVWDAPSDTHLKTVNGNVWVHMLGGSLDVETTNGAIVSHVLDEAVKGLDLTSKNGSITVVLHEGTSATVDARSHSGVVKKDLAVDASAGIDRRRHLEGIIGEGKTRIQAMTLNGNIWFAEGG